MANAIGWCDETINPFTGCRGGCTYCYARRMAQRLSHIPGTPYHALRQAGLDPFTPAFHWDVWQKAKRKIRHWRKPRRIFLGSMGEIGSNCFRITDRSAVEPPEMTLSTEGVLRAVFHLAIGTPHHTFLLLTKQPWQLPMNPGIYAPNMQMGVSLTGPDVAGQLAALDERLPEKMIRWASFEPLLHPVDWHTMRAARLLHWVVIGAQTGPGAPDPGATIAAARALISAIDGACPVYVKDNLRRLAPAQPWPQEVYRGPSNHHDQDSGGHL